MSRVARPAFELPGNSSFEIAFVPFIDTLLLSLSLSLILLLLEEVVRDNGLSKGDVFIVVLGVDVLVPDGLLHGLLQFLFVELSHINLVLLHYYLNLNANSWP